MPLARPIMAMTHWRALSAAMFIPKLLRQGHLARGIEQGKFVAVGECPDGGDDRPGR